jgi:hypothetical protein
MAGVTFLLSPTARNTKIIYVYMGLQLKLRNIYFFSLWGRNPFYVEFSPRRSLSEAVSFASIKCIVRTHLCHPWLSAAMAVVRASRDVSFIAASRTACRATEIWRFL